MLEPEKAQFEFSKKISYIEIRLMLAGLFAISLIILQNLLSLTSVSVSQFIALVSFCVAIPLLAGSFYITTIDIEASDEMRVPTLLGIPVAIALFLGPIADFVGISADIWHVSHIACCVFTGTVLLVVAMCTSYSIVVFNDSLLGPKK